MNLALLWIALAAFGGAILHGVMQTGVGWKQTIITAIITAIAYAVGLNFSGSLSILLILSAILGGYGVNAGVTAFRQKKQLDLYKNKMNQPK